MPASATNDAVISTTLAVGYTLVQNSDSSQKKILCTEAFSGLLYNEVSRELEGARDGDIEGLERYDLGSSANDEFCETYGLNRAEINKLYSQQKKGTKARDTEAAHILSFELFSKFLVKHQISLSSPVKQDIAVLLNRGKNLYIKSRASNRLDRRHDREIAAWFFVEMEHYQYSDSTTISSGAEKRLKRIITSCEKFLLQNYNDKTKAALSSDTTRIISSFVSYSKAILRCVRPSNYSTYTTPSIDDLTQEFSKMQIDKKADEEKRVKAQKREEEQYYERQRQQQRQERSSSSSSNYGSYDCYGSLLSLLDSRNDWYPSSSSSSSSYNTTNNNNNNSSSNRNPPSGFHYTQSSNPTGPLRRDGAPDMRYKANRQ